MQLKSAETRTWGHRIEYSRCGSDAGILRPYFLPGEKRDKRMGGRDHTQDDGPTEPIGTVARANPFTEFL